MVKGKIDKTKQEIELKTKELELTKENLKQANINAEKIWEEWKRLEIEKADLSTNLKQIEDKNKNMTETLRDL